MDRRKRIETMKTTKQLKTKTKKPIVIVRDHMAGVHVGTLEKHDQKNKTCVLTNARKIWSWYGAGSCHGLAAYGLDTHRSKVAPVVSRVEMNDVVEVVWCSCVGAQICLGAPEWKP